MWPVVSSPLNSKAMVVGEVVVVLRQRERLTEHRHVRPIRCTGVMQEGRAHH